MESLYRKYRPLTFESVVGQQHIVSTLEHAVAEGRLSHAYLFCGPRGTGKTTMARILAKALMCQGAASAREGGASGCMPDGTCPECEAIAEGTHPDVYELDAASRTGVDSVREEIINSVSFAPVRGAYKVYIIDEVHMLTTAAFNALLKTLEEPPSHVVFVMCTTDPQKILETILSRCQRFDFHRISNEDITGRLRYICGQEGFSFDEEALDIVARHARGGMRDALSTLEQLSVFGGGSVRVSDARALLGEASSAVLGEFSRGIAERDVASLFGLIRSQVEEGDDLMELTRDLVAHMRDLYIVRVAGASPELFDGDAERARALDAEAARFESADRLARTLTVLDDAALEMRNASDVRLVLEIACTRLARPEADLTLEALAERISRLEAQCAAGAPSAPVLAVAAAQGATVPPVAGARDARVPAAAAAQSARVSTAAVSRPAHSVPAGRAAASAAKPAADRAFPWEKPAAAPVVSEPAPAEAVVAEPASQRVAAPAPAFSEPVASDAGDLQRKWDAVFRAVRERKPACGSLLLSARAKSDDGSTLVVGFPAGSGFAMKMVARADTQKMVSEAVSQVFGARKVEFVMAAASVAAGPAPAADATPAVSSEAAVAAKPVARASAPIVAPAPKAPSAPSVAPRPAVPGAIGGAVVAGGAGSETPPWEPSSAPAPSSGSAAVDHSSGPTVLPEPDVDAQRRAWENDQVPYDDATIASYEDATDEPPIDMPFDDAPAQFGSASAAAVSESGQAPVPAPVPGPVSSKPVTPPVAASAASGAMPWENRAAVEDEIPQTEAQAKEMLGNIFGPGIVFKSEE